MTDKTVFQGTFAKIQQVSGRKVTQFIIEVPTEAANHALQCLGGLPMPDETVWVCVARMDGKSE